MIHEGIFKNQLVSYFEVMTDEHFFSNYLSKGISKSDLIITAIDRDLSPLNCEGEDFIGEEHEHGGYGSIPNWVLLD